MEIVKDPKFDWLGKKFIFMGASLLLVAAGAASLLTSGLGLSVDFTGGSLVFVKFKDTPDLERIRSVMADPQFQARNFFVDIGHPALGNLKYPGAPFEMSGTPWDARSPAPTLGQHNQQVIGRRLGYTNEQLAQMRAMQII